MGHLLSRRDALRISATTVIAGTICGDALPSAAATIPIGKVGREQDAMADFLQATDFMRRIADDDRVKGFADLNDNLIQAIASFGVGELHARRAERLQALKLSGSRSQAAAIAVAVGVWIWALFRCGAGKCSLSEGLAYFVIFAVAVLITKFC